MERLREIAECVGDWLLRLAEMAFVLLSLGCCIALARGCIAEHGGWW